MIKYFIAIFVLSFIFATQSSFASELITAPEDGYLVCKSDKLGELFTREKTCELERVYALFDDAYVLCSKSNNDFLTWRSLCKQQGGVEKRMEKIAEHEARVPFDQYILCSILEDPSSFGIAMYATKCLSLKNGFIKEEDLKDVKPELAIRLKKELQSIPNSLKTSKIQTPVIKKDPTLSELYYSEKEKTKSLPPVKKTTKVLEYKPEKTKEIRTAANGAYLLCSSDKPGEFFTKEIQCEESRVIADANDSFVICLKDSEESLMWKSKCEAKNGVVQRQEINEHELRVPFDQVVICSYKDGSDSMGAWATECLSTSNGYVKESDLKLTSVDKKLGARLLKMQNEELRLSSKVEQNVSRTTAIKNSSKSSSLNSSSSVAKKRMVLSPKEKKAATQRVVPAQSSNSVVPKKYNEVPSTSVSTPKKYIPIKEVEPASVKKYNVLPNSDPAPLYKYN